MMPETVCRPKSVDIEFRAAGEGESTLFDSGIHSRGVMQIIVSEREHRLKRVDLAMVGCTTSRRQRGPLFDL